MSIWLINSHVFWHLWNRERNKQKCSISWKGEMPKMASHSLNHNSWTLTFALSIAQRANEPLRSHISIFHLTIKPWGMMPIWTMWNLWEQTRNHWNCRFLNHQMRTEMSSKCDRKWERYHSKTFIDYEHQHIICLSSKWILSHTMCIVVTQVRYLHHNNSYIWLRHALHDPTIRHVEKKTNEWMNDGWNLLQNEIMSFWGMNEIFE